VDDGPRVIASIAQLVPIHKNDKVLPLGLIRKMYGVVDKNMSSSQSMCWSSASVMTSRVITWTYLRHCWTFDMLVQKTIFRKTVQRPAHFPCPFSSSLVEKVGYVFAFVASFFNVHGQMRRVTWFIHDGQAGQKLEQNLRSGNYFALPMFKWMRCEEKLKTLFLNKPGMRNEVNKKVE